jgi:hypothetical protein
VVENALKQHFDITKNPKMLIFNAPAMTHVETDIVGVAENFRIEDGYLMAEIGFFEEKMSEVGEEGEIITIRPEGHGSVNQDTHMVDDTYTISGLVIRHRPKENI